MNDMKNKRLRGEDLGVVVMGSEKVEETVNTTDPSESPPLPPHPDPDRNSVCPYCGLDHEASPRYSSGNQIKEKP